MNNNQTGTAKVLKIVSIVVLLVVIALVGKYLLFTNSASAFSKPATRENTANIAVLNGDYQEVTIQLASSAYAPIVVQQGIPVRFHIQADAKNINGCNGTVIIPMYNVEVTLKPGDNLLEFTMKESGTIPYSCWMGMITSSIQAVDDISKVDASTDVSPVINSDLSMPCCQTNPE